MCETYGLAKQGGEFAYTGVRGYHPLIASLADTGELLHARLRGGNAGSGRGAASFIAETISRVRNAGAAGRLALRADSGFYAGSVVSACRRHNVAFSVTARKNTAIQRAISQIPDDAWTPIPYWLDGGADVAETTYTAFAGTRHETTARLIIRRVRPTPGSQLALDVVFSYHAIFTDRIGPLLDVETRPPPACDRRAHHRRPQTPRRTGAPALRTVHRQRRLARADRNRLQPHPLAANAAGLGRITTKTLRLTIIVAPARLVTSARRPRLRLPTRWPWADHITTALAIIRAIDPEPG